MLPIAKKKRRERASQDKKLAFDLGGNKIFFISLGCPRNLVDSEVMLGILLRAGYEPAQELLEADFIVINTCGFLEAARQESLDTIHMATEERKSGAKVIVTGCMVQQHREKVKEAFPHIDYLLGSGDVEGILEAVQERGKGEAITSARSYLEMGEVPRVLSTPPHYAYLKIAEGCKKRCAYCIIPDIKGPLRSKPEEQILKEFRALRKQGVQEIILIAQDLGDWGRDRGFKRAEGLEHLLCLLLQEEGDFWLRLLYLYPDEITPELVSVIRSDPRICPYLDLPIQHVNDELLKAMRRATTRKKIIDTLTLLREEIPEIAIRTSLIVGYPGETKEQFEELVGFIQTYPIDHLGVFPFSPEPGSHAATLPQQIDSEVKEERFRRLMGVQQKVLAERLQGMVGRTVDVVVDGFHHDSSLLLRGRHRGMCPEVDNMVIINNAHKVEAFGHRYPVEITSVAGYDLVGSVV